MPCWRLRHFVLTCLALTAFAVALPGCGGGGNSTSDGGNAQLPDENAPLTSDEKAARDVFDDYLKSLVKPDYKRACSLMTKAARKEVDDLGKSLARDQRKKLSRVAIVRLRSGCAGTFETINGQVGSRQLTDARRRTAKLKIVSVQVRGNRAVVITNQSQKKAAMQRVNGEWRVSG